jgi:hypothetical protein
MTALDHRLAALGRPQARCPKLGRGVAKARRIRQMTFTETERL